MTIFQHLNCPLNNGCVLGGAGGGAVQLSYDLKLVNLPVDGTALAALIATPPVKSYIYDQQLRPGSQGLPSKFLSHSQLAEYRLDWSEAGPVESGVSGVSICQDDSELGF